MLTSKVPAQVGRVSLSPAEMHLHLLVQQITFSSQVQKLKIMQLMAATHPIISSRLQDEVQALGIQIVALEEEAELVRTYFI